jgi:ABC-type dipeptide/oligopeptide/nickel transport system ATPase subunit
MSARIFDHRPAVREKTPILVGLVGPSGSGKTFSALRVASGFQRVTGGETFVIDTEARRALHYAEKFKFQHVAFGAPFSPLDYLDAINYCVGKGATTIVVDSMSHEHEGPGGVLEMHQAEHERLGGREGTKLLAWNKPKSARRRLINSILQLPCNFVFCFRAKEKLKIEKGRDPEKLGFMPIAGEEFVYEMTLKCLLLPGANGVPTWQSDFFGEKAMIKLPEQFRSTFASSPQLTEDIGQRLATWGAGAAAPKTVSADDLIAQFAACSDAATFRALEETRGRSWSALSKDDKARVKAASHEASERVQAEAAA